MNALNVISPYKHLGVWVFDDPRVGLAQEPFVAGADTMIDRVVADIPNADGGFTLIFSSAPFPGHQHRLDWHCAEDGGDWYHSEELQNGRLALPRTPSVLFRSPEAHLHSGEAPKLAPLTKNDLISL
jgi:Family of unknown function (DUF6717)